MRFAAIFLIPAMAITFVLAQHRQRGVSLPSEPIQVQKRIALVIGNQAYSEGPLKNPANDVAAIARLLRELRFNDVTEKRDLTMRQMREEVNRFAARINRGDLALFYYAGHGIQANEQNYLIPIDFAGTSEADLDYEAHPAAQVRDKLEQSGARLRIIILDACRNNPFRAKRDGTRGLAPWRHPWKAHILRSRRRTTALRTITGATETGFSRNICYRSCGHQASI